MKCSLGISTFLEEISSLSHSVVFLYFFALIAEELGVAFQAPPGSQASSRGEAKDSAPKYPHRWVSAPTLGVAEHAG